MDWTTVSELGFEDVLYQHAGGIARISINRPEVHNAFRPETVMELQRAFTHAHHDPRSASSS
jgi:naphthoate synthase